MSSRPITVLVVEDEPLILLHAVDIVEQAGMIAVEAVSASAALLALEENADIEIIFSDIDLPGAMNGLVLASQVRERWPQIGLVLTSGHMLSRSIQIPEGGVFLPKPYRPGAVIEVLRTMSGKGVAGP